MYRIRPTRPLVALAVLAALTACADRGPLDVAPSPPEVPADPLARGLALALADPALQGYVVDQIRHSPVQGHRVALRTLLAGAEGEVLAAAVASSAGVTPAGFDALLAALPSMEVYFPSTLDRIEWPVAREIVVTAAMAPRAELADAEIPTGYGRNGEPVVLPSRGHTPFAVLLLAPEEAGGPRRMMTECDRFAKHCDPGSGGGTSSWGYTLPGVSWNACTTSPADDLDADGISDACEFALAHAFRPILGNHRLDGALTKEPYWSVRPDGPGAVQVMYLLSYHFDPGELNTGWTQHYGDSEFIILRIVNPSLGGDKWYLSHATLSAHWGNWWTDATYSGSAAYLEYPGADRGRPRVWVARGKHANYKSKSDCAWGGLGTDTCSENDLFENLDVRADRNIGNTGYGGGIRLRDCVASTIGGVNRARIECFFTGNFFGGWITHAVQSNSAGPYRTVLRAYNFMSAGAGTPIDDGPCDPYAKHCG